MFRRPRLFSSLLFPLLIGGCTAEVQEEGDHGVAVEDTTLVADSSGTASEVPAVLQEQRAP
jgi:hypothetical protein